MQYQLMDRSELNLLYQSLKEAYDSYQTKNLKLDMSRGKPCSQQLDLSIDMLGITDYKAEGIDCRNYGGLDGLPEIKEIFAQILGVSPKQVIVGGNSSLAMMHDTVARAMLLGVVDSETPWVKLPIVKFLCPSPGYDRHFAICELFGIQMITVGMNEDGPDMDEVERLAAEDDSIKGIWCIPYYSNPTGIVYLDEVVERLAKMETKAPDFKIFWDNAYAVHHLNDKPKELRNILDACNSFGHPDRVFMFSSTSKISFAGAGVAAMASSSANIDFIMKQLNKQTIGPDKLNQLRHLQFFGNIDGINEHMKKHAEIIRPKFDRVLEILDEELADLGIASWTHPEGGYFISLDTMEGCAKRVVELALSAGVVLTPAGATFPYGKDPKDQNIRIAPTFPPMDELEQAMKLVSLCVKLVSVEKMLSN